MSDSSKQPEHSEFGERPCVVRVVEPAAVLGSELVLFKELVLEGGEVNPRTLPGLVTNAQSLALAKKGNLIVGVGGNKRPLDMYRAKVFRRAGVELDPKQFEFELGWVYVRLEARRQGIAPALVESLVSAVGEAAIYATSAIDKTSMHAALERSGFGKVGSPYASEENDADIQLFVRM